ncbi:MAG: hypothetical protein ACQER9_00930 [Nanobdellota archaeon]
MIEYFSEPRFLIILIMAVLLFITVLLPDKYDFFLSSLIMFSIGGIQLCDAFDIFSIKNAQSPVFDFAAIFILTYAARDLVYEGINGNKGLLKIFLFISGILLLLLTSLPILYDVNLISFDPDLNIFGNNIKSSFYLLSGFIMIIGSFLILDEY